ncbi:MAG: Spy/CpxP family protein refolding chaperone [Epsilonproteobacteria bacterium]|nr:Spy/CpxP family protein refolding chaperone [Campylobacterota bacterium]
MKTIKLLSIAALTGALTMGTLYAETNTSDNGFKKGYHCKTKGEGGKHFGKQHRGGYLGKIMKQLDLTDDQKASLKALRAEKRENRKAMFETMRTAKQTTLANAVTADGFNKAQFIKDATTQFESKIAQKADNMEKMMNILTAEQRTKFVELLKADN